jgi:hypothetical protein
LVAHPKTAEAYSCFELKEKIYFGICFISPLIQSQNVFHVSRNKAGMMQNAAVFLYFESDLF